MNDDLSSEFDSSEGIDKKRKRLDLAVKSYEDKPTTSDKAESSQQWHKEDRQQKYLVLDAYSRHKLLINEYMLTHAGATKKLCRDTSQDRTDLDVIRANSKFLWSDNDQLDTWESKLAKRYYDKLFKEYCVTDLSRYKENKIALRWRIKQEVVDGKGQFICADKKCKENQDLTSWEVNFAYIEDGTKKNALVKLRLCPDCSYKLNYHKKHNMKKSAKKLSKSIKREPESDRQESGAPQTLNADVSDVKSESQEQTPDLVTPTDNKVWAKPVEAEEDKSREEEFEDFLQDLFV